MYKQVALTDVNSLGPIAWSNIIKKVCRSLSYGELKVGQVATVLDEAMAHASSVQAEDILKLAVRLARQGSLGDVRPVPEWFHSRGHHKEAVRLAVVLAKTHAETLPASRLAEGYLRARQWHYAAELGAALVVHKPMEAKQIASTLLSEKGYDSTSKVSVRRIAAAFALAGDINYAATLVRQLAKKLKNTLSVLTWMAAEMTQMHGGTEALRKLVAVLPQGTWKKPGPAMLMEGVLETVAGA